MIDHNFTSIPKSIHTLFWVYIIDYYCSTIPVNIRKGQL